MSVIHLDVVRDLVSWLDEFEARRFEWISERWPTMERDESGRIPRAEVARLEAAFEEHAANELLAKTSELLGVR